MNHTLDLGYQKMYFTLTGLWIIGQTEYPWLRLGLGNIVLSGLAGCNNTRSGSIQALLIGEGTIVSRNAPARTSYKETSPFRDRQCARTHAVVRLSFRQSARERLASECEKA